jgi:hypothetical protein
VTLAATVRRWYWKRIRRYRGETCGRPNHMHGAIRRGCGRPVGVIWRAPSGIWNYVVAGQYQTTYTVREGAAGGPVMERSEGVGGVLCPGCFDRLAQERGLLLQWTARPFLEKG